MTAFSFGTRIEFKNILFATDFSPPAGVAAKFAAKLAKQYDAKLYALHVRPTVVNPMTQPTSWKGSGEAAKMEDEQNRKELAHAFTGIQPEVLIREGNFWSNLEAALEKNDVDLIAIGTRGRSGIRKFVLGSTAEEIFRRVSCPVLTVGPNASAPGLRAGESSRILFATDFSPESYAAAPYAVSLAEECHACLTLLHVIEDPKVGDLVHSTELLKSSDHLLRKLMPAESELWCVPEYLVEQGLAADKILEVAVRCRAELIVLGVRQPSGFPGAATHLPIATAHKIVSRAACPVLTVRG
jgi:nucleotide-binding universal stress UspA family protein